MDNKHFKKLLKESLQNGGATLFEEEEASLPDSLKKDEDEQNKEDEKKDNTLKSDDEKALAAALKTAAAFAGDIKKSENFDLSSFSKIFAYYFLAMHHDDADDWEASLSSANVFNQNVGEVLKNHAADKDNIICTFTEVVDWILKYPAFKSSDVWVNSLRTQRDQTLIRKLLTTLNSIEKKKYSLSSGNIKALKSLISRVGSDFKMKDCPKSGAPEKEKEEVKIRTKEQQPMSLESLKVVIKKTNAKDYATRIINALKKDMRDLRVRVNEAREKTPPLTNTIAVLEAIPDLEMQKSALKSLFTFFKVNKLQIDDETKSKLVKSGILTINQKPKKDNEKPKPQDGEKTEDPKEEPSEEETIEFETPENKQSLAIFNQEIDKVPVLKYYTDDITKVIMDIAPPNVLGRVAIDPAALKEEELEEIFGFGKRGWEEESERQEKEEAESAAYTIQDANDLIKLLLKIKEERTIKIAKIAYVLISRFLTRNGIKINKKDEALLKRYGMKPKNSKEAIEILRNTQGRRLEERRYYRLLERFNIK